MAHDMAYKPGSFAGMGGAVFDCEDMDFFATWDDITIIPNFTGVKISCICVSSAPDSNFG